MNVEMPEKEGMFAFPPNSYAKNPNPDGDCIRRWDFCEMIYALVKQITTLVKETQRARSSLAPYEDC